MNQEKYPFINTNILDKESYVNFESFLSRITEDLKLPSDFKFLFLTDKQSQPYKFTLYVFTDFAIYQIQYFDKETFQYIIHPYKIKFCSIKFELSTVKMSLTLYDSTNICIEVSSRLKDEFLNFYQTTIKPRI